MQKTRLLISAVGSLVGQNILDVLDFQDGVRRRNIHVIGTNSIAENTNNFRCDECFIVPNSSDPHFSAAITEILCKVSPHLILCGRDEDTEVFCKLKETHPDLPGLLPHGSSKALMIALDKYQTWLFSLAHKLPFAETCRASDNSELLHAFVSRVGFPLIAKPARGFASRGVFFLRKWEDISTVSAFPDYIIQEYLGNPQTNDAYFNMMDQLVPLFASAPQVSHHSCHTFINPSGDIEPIFISHNVHEAGRTIGFSKVVNQELDDLALRYARAVYADGGTGPLTVQFRKSQCGSWKVQEINMRTNGNTFPRMLLGQDDIELIIRTFLPGHQFLKNVPDPSLAGAIFSKTLSAIPILSSQLQHLKAHGHWTRDKV